MLRHGDLDEDYAAAWEEWDASGERDAWESTVGDGLSQVDDALSGHLQL